MGAGCLRESYSKLKNDALKQLFKAISSAIEYGEQIRFDKDNFSHQMMIGTFLAMTETTDSIRVLIEADKVYDAEVLLRTLMEMRVRLELFATHPEFTLREKVEFFKRQQKIFCEAKRGNKYFVKVDEELNVDIELATATKTLESLTSGGVKGQLTFLQMCQRLGFEDEYRAVYSGLSQAPHGTYASIVKRSFVIDKSTEQFSVTGFREPEIGTVELVAESASGWLNSAEAILMEFLIASHIKQPS